MHSISFISYSNFTTLNFLKKDDLFILDNANPLFWICKVKYIFVNKDTKNLRCLNVSFKNSRLAYLQT